MRRKLGQHFLIDKKVIARIFRIAAISADDCVLEIGPGQGILTNYLASKAKQLIAIEYDPILAEHLHKQFGGQEHVRILRADARHIRYEKIFSGSGSRKHSIKVVANLPYYAAIPIMKRLFGDSRLFSECTLMFQKEVAERITASPGNKSYGSLSVAAQYYGVPEYRFLVPSRAFRPPPNVESAVITLHFLDYPRVEVLDQEYFFQLVKCAFLTRRKTLKNSLMKSGSGRFLPDLLRAAFEELHFHKHIRGEELSVEDFANLSNMLVRMQKCEKLF